MNRIKELRIRDGVMQSDLAAIIGVAPSTLSGYEVEKTQADIGTYKKIADHFGVTLDYLFGGPASPDPITLPAPFPEVTDRYSRLSEVDRLRVLAYMDGILSGEKYSSSSKRGAV